jgi:hypothetical protein
MSDSLWAGVDTKPAIGVVPGIRDSHREVSTAVDLSPQGNRLFGQSLRALMIFSDWLQAIVPSSLLVPNVDGRAVTGFGVLRHVMLMTQR